MTGPEEAPLYWRGKPIVLLDHEELLQAFIQLATIVRHSEARIMQLHDQIETLIKRVHDAQRP